MFDLTDVTFIRRITIGGTNPQALPTEGETETAMNLLNRCLNDMPKGRIVGIEKNFSVLNVGEHQVVLQAVVYHVGFSRKPAWMLEDLR